MTFDEVLAEIEQSVEPVTITLSDGYSYEVGTAYQLYGDREDLWASDLMGNIYYSSARSCLGAIYGFLSSSNRTIVEVY